MHALLQQGGARKAAILCPTGLFGTWKREIQKLMPRGMRPQVVEDTGYEYPGAVQKKLRIFRECAACHVAIVGHEIGRASCRERV